MIGKKNFEVVISQNFLSKTQIFNFCFIREKKFGY